jgi:alkanesulfonate monooxygenase SsuD/methylene tetrahydromethanopterin reductase-like flavin-dependent oxidoreductase (luciferase family)
MRLSYFTPPAHPPETPIFDAIEWELQVIRWSEELGFDEYWIGEHFTDTWEPVPAPDLVLAQALKQTSTIKLGPAGHVLPYHHPADLAHRIAQLDNMAQGRYQLGMAAGQIPSDWAMFGVDGVNGAHREMFAEALEIILWIWSRTEENAGTFEGKYWTVVYPTAKEFGKFYRGFLKPFSPPRPPMAVTGFTPHSGTLKMAGARGYIPMSLNLSAPLLHTHWDAYTQGSESAGMTPSRSVWRVLKETFVAETDAEARRLVLEGPMARMMREYWLPNLAKFGMLGLLKRDQSMPDADVTVEWLVDNSWLVGSPTTVTEKLEQMHDEAGGFGHLMIYGANYLHDPGAWHTSLGLLATEVLPKLQGVGE